MLVLLVVMKLSILCTTCAVLLSATRGSSSSLVSTVRNFDSASQLLKLPATQYIGVVPLFGRQVEETSEDSVVPFLLPATKLKQKDVIQEALQNVEFHLKKLRARSVSDGNKSFLEPVEAALSLKPKVGQGKASTSTLAELNFVEDDDTDERAERVRSAETEEDKKDAAKDAIKDDGRNTLTGSKKRSPDLDDLSEPVEPASEKRAKEIAGEIIINGSDLTLEQTVELSDELAKDLEFGKNADQLKDIPLSNLDEDFETVVGTAGLEGKLEKRNRDDDDDGSKSTHATIPVSIISALGVAACIAGAAFLVVTKRKKYQEKKVNAPFSGEYRPNAKSSYSPNIIAQNARLFVDSGMGRFKPSQPERPDIEYMAEDGQRVSSNGLSPMSLDKMSSYGFSNDSETPWAQNTHSEIGSDFLAQVPSDPKVQSFDVPNLSNLVNRGISNHDTASNSRGNDVTEGHMPPTGIYPTITRDSNESHGRKSVPFHQVGGSSSAADYSLENRFGAFHDQSYSQSQCSLMMTRTLLSINQTLLSIGPQAVRPPETAQVGLHIAICLDTSSAFSEGEFTVIKRLLCNGMNGLVDKLAVGLEGETLCTLVTYAESSPPSQTMSSNSTTDLCALIANQSLAESHSAREIHLGLHRCFNSLRSTRNGRSAELRRVVVLTGGAITENGRSGVGFAAWEAARALHSDGVPVVVIDFSSDVNDPGQRIASGDPPLYFPVEGVADFSKVIDPLALLLGNPHLTPDIDTYIK